MNPQLTIEELKAKLIDSDDKYLIRGVRKRILKRVRHERFVERYLPKLEERMEVSFIEDSCLYVFDMPPYGVVEFYPKPNKMYIRKLDTWLKPALTLIVTELKLV